MVLTRLSPDRIVPPSGSLPLMAATSSQNLNNTEENRVGLLVALVGDMKKTPQILTVEIIRQNETRGEVIVFGEGS